MVRPAISSIGEASGDLLPLEIVERKGLGHPDTICDHLTEALGLVLSRSYRRSRIEKELCWDCKVPLQGHKVFLA